MYVKPTKNDVIHYTGVPPPQGNVTVSFLIGYPHSSAVPPAHQLPHHSEWDTVKEIRISSLYCLHSNFHDIVLVHRVDRKVIVKMYTFLTEEMVILNIHISQKGMYVHTLANWQEMFV